MNEDQIKSIIQFTIEELGKELAESKDTYVSDAIYNLGRNDGAIGHVGEGLHKIADQLGRIASLYNCELGYKLDGDIK